MILFCFFAPANRTLPRLAASAIPALTLRRVRQWRGCGISPVPSSAPGGGTAKNQLRYTQKYDYCFLRCTRKS